MEQAGISIIQTGGITDTTVGKSKSVGISFGPGNGLQAAKEKLKTPFSTASRYLMPGQPVNHVVQRYIL
ncbi:uncharacterized protein LOC122533577 isoform X2 [Frieseomelitta varia]|uniref:uncharacterized protein LOC122533577 isoform X2 n=1 Tax=Frieseomelitta varia TaxID=561572 RepID=UPI001CB68444|nr:uncharacterized protein LOC122533577 isoform X2 [Frieseomelitta varia]XP_043519573.1 uncharacterized protein LOC122533577 isoform X2 [Frieseomelitta varia]